MVSYLITGAGRGIGWGFVQSLSKDPKNVVIGIVRRKGEAEERVAKELSDRKNIHMLQADMTDIKSLTAAVSEVSKITGGSLDMLIANANSVFKLSTFDPLSELGGGDDPALQQELLNAFNVNVVGNIYLTNAVLPLLRKGSVKKVVYLSTGFGDVQFNLDLSLYEHGPYCISKAALNMMVGKYHAKHKDEGILFMGISPGVVDSGAGAGMKPEEMPKLQTMMGKFMAAAPHMTGPISVSDSVTAVMGVVDNATIEGNGGQMVSHYGNKTWL